MFDWLKLLLAPSAENDCHEKTYEAEMVFRQFAMILSILESSPASKGLFEESWSHFVALVKSIDPSLMLFRFIYTVASTNLIDQGYRLTRFEIMWPLQCHLSIQTSDR